MAEPDSFMLMRLAPLEEAIQRQETALKNLTVLSATQAVAITRLMSLLGKSGALPVAEAQEILRLVRASLPESDRTGAPGAFLEQLSKAVSTHPEKPGARH
jgi:hypothetical protein